MEHEKPFISSPFFLFYRRFIRQCIKCCAFNSWRSISISLFNWMSYFLASYHIQERRIIIIILGHEINFSHFTKPLNHKMQKSCIECKINLNINHKTFRIYCKLANIFEPWINTQAWRGGQNQKEDYFMTTTRNTKKKYTAIHFIDRNYNLIRTECRRRKFNNNNI